MAKKSKRAKAPSIIKRAAAKPGQSVAMDYFSNYAALDSAYGSAMHNITTSPTLNNAAGGQFWQTVGSSGIASGTALGAPYNIGIQPGSSWPYNVFTTPNTNNDLGVFPYTGSVIDSVTGSGTQASGTMP